VSDPERTEPSTETSTAVSVEVSIVMPCRNEARTVAQCVAEARDWLERRGVDGEVVVVDNGSTDDSARIAREAGARVVDAPEPGYGSALRTGIRHAVGRFVIMGDADQSYDFSDLDAFIDELRGGAALVIGDRFAGGIEPGAMPALHRYVGNPLLSFLGRVFFGIPVHDFHCGLRGFDRAAIDQLDLRTSGMEFASEMVVKAALAELPIREVPTTLRPDGRDRPPHLRTWSDGWRHLRFLLLYSPRWLFLVPGLVIFAVGLVASVVLVIGPVTIGSVTFDVGTLVYAAATTFVGAQAIGFALLTRSYAESRGLLPPDPALARFFRIASLERGLLLAAIIALAGLAAALVSLARWWNEGFGALDPARQIRVVVPAMLGIVHGVSLAFTSFALSITRLDVGRR
jgi:hypothetical protein